MYVCMIRLDEYNLLIHSISCRTSFINMYWINKQLPYVVQLFNIPTYIHTYICMYAHVYKWINT